VKTQSLGTLTAHFCNISAAVNRMYFQRRFAFKQGDTYRISARANIEYTLVRLANSIIDIKYAGTSPNSPDWHLIAGS